MKYKFLQYVQSDKVYNIQWFIEYVLEGFRHLSLKICMFDGKSYYVGTF
jgi:hypothetical protein